MNLGNKHFLPIIGVIFAVFVLLLMVPPQKTLAFPSAQNGSDQSIDDMIKAYQAYWSLRKCNSIQNITGAAGTAESPLGTPVTTAQIREGQVFHEKSRNNRQEYRTNVLLSRSNTSSMAGCNTNSRGLHSWIGVQAGDSGNGLLEFLSRRQSFGGGGPASERNIGPIYNPPQAGEDNYRLSEGGVQEYRQLITAQFARHRPNINTTNPMPAYAQYRISYASFINNCQGDPSPDGLLVRLIGPDGVEVDSTNSSFVVPNESTHVGYGIQNPPGDNTINGEQINCRDLVALMNRTADDYLNYLELNPDDDPLSNEDITGDAPAETCEDGGGFNWVMCPAVGLVAGTFDWLGGQIESLLYVDIAFYKNDAGLQEASLVIRSLAYVLIVPAMLVMVISTALGFELFGAYTVKKALPRMIAAVIFIALSWEITSLLIEVTNAIGQGIRGIILNPFEIEGFRDVFDRSAGSSGLQWAGIIGGAGLVALSSTVLGILVSFLGTAGLILLTIFLFLVAREVFIVGLMLVAPLAIIAWIFPGKTKLWNTWWGLFSKLLFIYPIIMLMAAAGLVFASLIGTNTIATGEGVSSLPVEGGLRVLEPILKTAAFVVPYALIPIAFKYVGGVAGNLAGMVNDKERGMFDRLKKGRQANYSKANQEMKAGTLTNKGGQVGERVGRAIGRTRSGRGLMPGRRGRLAGDAAMASARNEQAAEAARDPALQQLAVNDEEATAIAAYGGGTNQGYEEASHDMAQAWADQDGVDVHSDAIQGRRRRALAAARAVGVSKANSQAAGMLNMQNKARGVPAGALGPDGRSVTARGLDRLHGDDTIARGQTEQSWQYHARENGRPDLGDDTVRGAINRVGAAKIVRGHANGVTAATQDSANRYNAAMTALRNGGGEDARLEALDASAELAGYRNALGADVSEDNKRIVYDMFGEVGLDTGSQQTIDAQLAAQIEDSSVPGGTGPVDARAVNRTQEQIRNRAGLYERGLDPRLADAAGGGGGGAGGGGGGGGAGGGGTTPP